MRPRSVSVSHAQSNAIVSLLAMISSQRRSSWTRSSGSMTSSTTIQPCAVKKSMSSCVAGRYLTRPSAAASPAVPPVGRRWRTVATRALRQHVQRTVGRERHDGDGDMERVGGRIGERLAPGRRRDAVDQPGEPDRRARPGRHGDRGGRVERRGRPRSGLEDQPVRRDRTPATSTSSPTSRARVPSSTSG